MTVILVGLGDNLSPLWFPSIALLSACGTESVVALLYFFGVPFVFCFLYIGVNLVPRCLLPGSDLLGFSWFCSFWLAESICLERSLTPWGDFLLSFFGFGLFLLSFD